MSGQTSILVNGQHNGDAVSKKTVPPPDVAHLIRVWRHRTGLTQEHLAHALGVTFSTVSRWENGHVRPSSLAWKALLQIAAERGSPLVEEHDSALPAVSDSLRHSERGVEVIEGDPCRTIT